MSWNIRQVTQANPRLMIGTGKHYDKRDYTSAVSAAIRASLRECVRYYVTMTDSGWRVTFKEPAKSALSYTAVDGLYICEWQYSRPGLCLRDNDYWWEYDTNTYSKD